MCAGTSMHVVAGIDHDRSPRGGGGAVAMAHTRIVEKLKRTLEEC